MPFATLLHNLRRRCGTTGRARHPGLPQASPRRAFKPRLEGLEGRTLLSTVPIVVTSLADSGTGTLRAAITTADGDSSQDYIIDFDVKGAIDLTSALPNLTSKIAIQGPGADSLTVRRATDTPFSIFVILQGREVSISDLTIANGQIDDGGGGIDNFDGTLTATNCIFDHNSADSKAGGGGGIENFGGTATVTNCTFDHNSAAFGGGIENLLGTLTVTNCTFDHNSASDGGGIDNFDTKLTVTDCTFDHNSAESRGGGIFNGGFGGETATVAKCTFTNNSASAFVDGGGGIYNGGTATLTACTLANNSAVGVGGGIFNTGTATVTNCTIANNPAFEGGAIDNSGTATVTNCTIANNPTAQGGGIANAGTATVTNCTIANNSATSGGGIFNDGTATVTNCTIANNPTAQGGGVFNVGTATVTNCTIANNPAVDGGGIFNVGTATVTNCTITNNSAVGVGGGIVNDFGTVTANNTIVAGNQSPLGPDVAAALDPSSCYNLIGDGSDLTGISDGTQGNQVGTAASPINPLLAPLQDNGGTTQTMALLPGSPAIDAGSNALAVDAGNTPLATDQRGVARVGNGTVDLGAFEARSFTIALTGGNGQGTTVDTAFLNPLVVTVTSAYGDPVQGGVVTFTAPPGGAGATFPVSGDTTTATIDPVGQAAVACMANTVAGDYAVTASARGARFPAGFSLTNTPDAAAALTGVAGTGQATTVGYAFATPLQVLVTDQYNNPVPGVLVTFAAPTSGPAGSFSGGAAVATDATGLATRTLTANTVAGSYTARVTAGGLTGGPVVFRLTNTPDAARSFAVSGFPSPTTAGAVHTAVVTARDQYGNTASGYAGVVHLSSTDRQAVLPPDAMLTNGVGLFSVALRTAGTQSVTATDAAFASLTGTESGISVNPSVATALVMVVPGTVVTGVPFSFSVTAVDSYGNVASGYSGTVHFSSSDTKAVLPANAKLTNGTGTFTATFKTKGFQTLKVTDVALSGLTDALAILVQQLKK
jgi:hypothetical protein